MKVCKLPPDAAATVALAAFAVVVAATLVDAAAAATDVAVAPVPAATVLPWSSTSGTAAKSVVIPKTALKASA